METEKVLSFLGLMRKAGKLSTGEENSRRAVNARKACLILLAADASENAAGRAGEFAGKAHCPLTRLPFGKEELAAALGTAPFAIAAVCDSGFASALQKKL